jgi:hypothetical protein
MIGRLVLPWVLLFPLWTACGDGATSRNGLPPSGAASTGWVAAASPWEGLSPQQEVFWERLQALCGRAFQGMVVLAPSDDDWWAAERVVMHVRECHDEEIRIPLHIDENRSRTWVVTRTGSGLRLKHDHRLPDGSPDTANTQYGGDTVLPGSIWRQEFPADAYSVDVAPARESQLWYLEIRPGDDFAYGLRREATGLRYHLEFDLTHPVVAPPPPWGT